MLAALLQKLTAEKICVTDFSLSFWALVSSAICFRLAKISPLIDARITSSKSDT
jgi:hypothetical protein